MLTLGNDCVIQNNIKIIDKQRTLDLFYGVLIDLLTRDPTPELISLAERESSYTVEEEEECKKLSHKLLTLA